MDFDLNKLVTACGLLLLVGCESNPRDFGENRGGADATQTGADSGQPGGSGNSGAAENNTSADADGDDHPITPPEGGVAETDDDEGSTTHTDADESTDSVPEPSAGGGGVGGNGAGGGGVGGNGAGGGGAGGNGVGGSEAGEAGNGGQAGVPALAVGEPCLDATECETGFCVDAVCCATQCDDECAQCDAAGSEGVCTASSEADCGEPQCELTMKLCDDECVAASVCCDECGGDTPVCENGTCVQRNQGAECDSDTECSSGFCEDGYCCDVACDGQCESCAVPGTPGTCLPVTTPRIDCEGDGECAGFCDGTPQNRKNCVFPDEDTTCGVAVCTNDTFTSEATCDGAGDCVSGSTMSCIYGCRTDSVPACASSCPGATENLCDGACVDTDSNPDACGSGCEVCEGATSECVDGECVACADASDCPDSADMICTARNECECDFGTHACPGDPSECWSDTDVLHCGSACVDCSQTYATPSCGAGNSCNNTCLNGRQFTCPVVGGKPTCSVWDFETGLEGWTLAAADAERGPRAASEIRVSTNQASSGSSSLAIPYDNQGDTARWVEIKVSLCSGGEPVDLRGKTVHWEVRLDPPPAQASGWSVFRVYEDADTNYQPYQFTFSNSGWDEHEINIGSDSNYSSIRAIDFIIFQDIDWSGTIYFDNIYME